MRTSRSSGPRGQIEVGTLKITYLPGKSGPQELKLVTMADFENLRRVIGAYRLVRQLREMARTDDNPPEVWEILNSTGIPKVQGLTPPTRRTTQIIVYRTDVHEGITVVRTVVLAGYDIQNVNLTDTFMVTVRK